MNNKERFDFKVKNGLRDQATDIVVVEKLINMLIDNLYKPKELHDGCFVTDSKKLEEYEIDGEPINWGDLKVVDVVKDRDSDQYHVLIDEAEPDDCEMFCEYITRFMKSWGWNVSVKTEW